ncbi:hypothetical protein H311_03878, partial [Anncaliia algerae PRA109]
VITKCKNLMPTCDVHNNNLAAPGFIVQIDETMLNFETKSLRGRFPNNRTDSICMVEIRNKIEILRIYNTQQV